MMDYGVASQMGMLARWFYIWLSGFSRVELIYLDLDLFKLLEELLQAHFRELYALRLVYIGGGELLECALLEVLSIFQCLIISL